MSPSGDAGIDATGRSAVVLGAGGAARAVLRALAGLGVGEVHIVARDPGKAEALSDLVPGGLASITPEGEDVPIVGTADLVVNATSIGLTSDESPIPAEVLHAELLVLDVIYAKTRLLKDAAAAGADTLDGELMLLHQGAAAFTLWTGQPAPLDLMQQKLAEARAEGIRSAEGEPAGQPSGALAE